MASAPTSEPRQVFIDSSVLIAAAISARGHARDLLMAGQQGRLYLSISELVLQETERNLLNKAPRAWSDFTLLCQVLTIRRVDPPDALVRAVAEVIVPKDAAIVAAGLHARAEFLGTYDRRHLLSQAELIQRRFGLVVATPDEVLRTIFGHP